MVGAATPSSDVSTIRSLRLENNRAIADHDAARMREVWANDIQLTCCGNATYSGASALAASYAQFEFKDPSFVEYVRIPQRIEVNGDGLAAQEYGRWIGVFKSPHTMHSGRYSALWKKDGGSWKIARESYVPMKPESQQVDGVLRSATAINLGGTPDWLVVTPGAVWVANDALKAVQRISTTTNRVTATVRVLRLRGSIRKPTP